MTELRKAFRRNGRAVLAVVALLAIGLGTGGYILGHQRLRFPVLEEEPVSLKIELATAQAVAPGRARPCACRA